LELFSSLTPLIRLHAATNPIEMQFYENMWVDRKQLDRVGRYSLHKSSKVMKQPFVKNS
jgi:hypothetical protein